MVIPIVRQPFSTNTGVTTTATQPLLRPVQIGRASLLSRRKAGIREILHPASRVMRILLEPDLFTMTSAPHDQKEDSQFQTFYFLCFLCMFGWSVCMLIRYTQIGGLISCTMQAITVSRRLKTDRFVFPTSDPKSLGRCMLHHVTTPYHRPRGMPETRTRWSRLVTPCSSMNGSKVSPGQSRRPACL